MNYHNFEIKGNNIVLVGDENGITQLMIDNNTKPVHIDKTWMESKSMFSEAEIQLHEYFEGKRTEFDLNLNPAGTDYQKQVWNELCKIPYGELRSYKQVAEMLGNGNASRAVGLANNRNPIPLIIPCHRVIGSNKNLVGYAYGVALKQELIDLEKTNLVFSKLSAYYGNINREAWGGKKSWWPAQSAFEMMIGAILTQNTNWQNVEKALTNLGPNLSPNFILNTSDEELAAIIRPSGYHNQKAKKVKALCEWFKHYDFETEKATAKNGAILRDELLEINGVGGETADSILVYALDKPSFIIDAYTRRIFSRVGISVPKNYDDFRCQMEKFVPRHVETYDYFHGLIVEHAKAHCTKTPKCEGCPLHPFCDKTEDSKQITLNL